MMTFNLIAFVLLLVSLINAVLGIYIRKQKTDTGADYLAFYLFMISITTFFYALMLMSNTLELQKIWIYCRYLGDVLTCPAILIFVLGYTGHQSWLRNKGFWRILIIPAAVYLVVITNDWHHLYYREVWLDTSGVLPILAKENGPLYWVEIGYSYLCLIASLAFMGRQFAHLSRQYFTQFGLVLLGTAVPILAHISYLLGWRIFNVLNPTYFGFAITGLVFTIALFRYRLLELRPIARDTAIQKAPISILILDKFQHLVEINPAARSEFRLAPGKAFGKEIVDIDAELATWLSACMPVMEELQTECTLGSRRDEPFEGRKRTYWIEISPLRDGSTLTGWLILMRNITAQIETQDRLKEDEAKLRFITDNTKAVLFMLDSNLRITYTSPFITRFLGYTNAEMLSLPAAAILLPSSVALLLEWIEKARKDFDSGQWKKYLDRIDTLDFEFIHRDGHHFWGETQFTYLFGENSSFNGLVGIARDISERVEAEKQKLEQQRALASLAEREQLARELHDSLGQVMATINIQSQTALKYLDEDQLELARASLQNLSELARISHGDLRELLLGLRQKFSEAPDFFTALEKYLHDFTHIYNLPVTAILPPPELRRPLDPIAEVQLLRVIQEGLSNIRKHACASQAAIVFTQNERETQIIIEDNGIGFLQTNQPDEIAQPGPTETPHYGQEIMRERLTSIGGSLQILSAPGKGTRIIAALPDQRVLTNPISITNLRVLIAEDHPLFRDGLRNLLVSRGVKVVGVAKDGQEAVDRAIELRPDIVILDIQMPVLDGVEVARQIKASAPEIRILILTMSTDENTLFNAIRAGASGYLLKDLKADEFIERLEALIRGETTISSVLARKLIGEFTSPSRQQDECLTDRQMQILKLMALRLTYAQIAERLYLSESAIKYHAAQIMERLQTSGRNQTLAEAARRGWIERRNRQQ